MKRQDIFDQMFEASPAELAGDGETPVAEHVRRSSSGGELARSMLQTQEGLNTALETFKPARSADEAIDRILSAPSDGPSVETKRQWQGKRQDRPPRRHRRATRVGVTLFALTCLISLFVLNRKDTSQLPPNRSLLTKPRPADVRLLTDQNVIIFETSKPDIKIVWFY